MAWLFEVFAGMLRQLLIGWMRLAFGQLENIYIHTYISHLVFVLYMHVWAVLYGDRQYVRSFLAIKSN